MFWRVCGRWCQIVAEQEGLKQENRWSEMIAVLVMQISNMLVTGVRCGELCTVLFTFWTWGFGEWCVVRKRSHAYM